MASYECQQPLQLLTKSSSTNPGKHCDLQRKVEGKHSKIPFVVTEQNVPAYMYQSAKGGLLSHVFKRAL